MKSILTAIAGDKLPAAIFNTLQALVTGTRKADNASNDLASFGQGADGVFWQTDAAGLANGTLVVIDSSIDWRDRVVSWEVVDFAAAANRIGGATDYIDWSGLSQYRAFGYSGRNGGYDAGGSAPTNGNPPVAAAGPPVSNTMVIAGSLRLYVDPSSHALCLYNGTGSTKHLLVHATASADTGAH